MRENLADVEPLEFETQDIIRPLSNPIKATGHITIMRGSLCPGGAVSKLTGKEGLYFDGRQSFLTAKKELPRRSLRVGSKMAA